MLFGLGFNNQWFNWIMEWITTTSFSMLINRKIDKVFHSEKGNRQGNPISPYIFIICTEHLDRYIHFMSTQRNFGIGIKLTKSFQIYLP